MNLNERSRRKFRALFEDVEPPRSLDEEAVRRLVQRVQREAQVARQRRLVVAVVAPAFALAAGALLYANQPTPSPVVEAAPRCTAMPEVADAARVVAETNVRRELGSLARVDVARDSAFAVVGESGCSTRVELASGSVSVWARDLAGGTLAVRTSLADVTVHGTTFEVRSAPDVTYVAVDEGRVEVRHGGGATMLGAGDALEVRAQGVTWVRLDALAHARLLAVHGDAPIASAEPTPTANTDAPTVAPAASETPAPVVAVATPPAPLDARATLREAEAAYREGRLDDARRLFRQAGATRGGLAEAAWVRLGRLELRGGRPSDAARAFAEHRRRFGNGSLAAEARVAEAQALRALGRGAEAAPLEAWVLEHRPDSPQAATLRARRAAP